MISLRVQIYLHHLFLLPSFTPTRRAAITRNTLDLLMLHKRFSKSLVDIIREEGLTATGGGVGAEERIVAATKRVAMVFAEEATDFASYEEYCAGHDEALSVIRQVESTPEWISYERRCSDLAKSRSRQNLDRLLSSPSVSYAGRLPLPSPSASSSASTPFSDDSSRLMLRDLLIKPIQRICRYPLVLASLLGSQKPTAEGDEGGGELETALAEMKVVASGVDEATRRKAAKGRTDIVLERMEVHPTLTPSILRSLDECLLVGALDVIYEHSIYAPLFPPVKVRYLAAFLYAGYLVLCKVKKGRVYQPTFFMALKSVQIEDCVQLGTDSESGLMLLLCVYFGRPFADAGPAPRSSPSRLVPPGRPRLLFRACHVRQEGEEHLARRSAGSKVIAHVVVLQAADVCARDLPRSPDRPSDVVLHWRPPGRYPGYRADDKTTFDAWWNGREPVARVIHLDRSLRRLGSHHPDRGRLPSRRHVPSARPSNSIALVLVGAQHGRRDGPEPKPPLPARVRHAP